MSEIERNPRPVYKPESFIVIAREDKKADGTKGKYTLATRTVFPTEAMAEAYAGPISPEREAMVVPGDFMCLRYDAVERFGPAKD